jgi:hypothetical protein
MMVANASTGLESPGRFAAKGVKEDERQFADADFVISWSICRWVKFAVRKVPFQLSDPQP